MIVPYPMSQTIGNSASAAAKRKFNTVHSSARMSIERAFGILSARWRFISKHVYIIETPDVCKTIVVACILHNFCININDPDFEPEDSSVEIDENELDDDPSSNSNFGAGRTRRDLLNRWFSRR